MQILPFVPSVPSYSFTTTISDAGQQPLTRQFVVHWNTVDQAWYFDLYDESQNLILGSVKCVLGVLLGRRSKDPLFTQGVVVVADSTSSGQEAGLDDMGTRVKVLRFTEAEIAQAYTPSGLVYKPQ